MEKLKNHGLNTPKTSLIQGYWAAENEYQRVICYNIMTRGNDKAGNQYHWRGNDKHETIIRKDWYKILTESTNTFGNTVENINSNWHQTLKEQHLSSFIFLLIGE